MLYELTLFTTFYQQKCINRWNYLMTGTPASALGSTALLDAFGALPAVGVFPPTALFAAIRELVNGAVNFDSIVAKALDDVEDFFETPFPQPLVGNGTGDATSPIDSFGFRTNRVRTDIGRGTKRFVGVSESYISAGGVLTGTALGLAVDLAEKMSEALTYDDSGNTLTFTPVVCQKERYTVPGSSPARYAYRYYEDHAEQLEHTAVGVTWEPYPNVRSQVSRQYGRGQ